MVLAKSNLFKDIARVSGLTALSRLLSVARAFLQLQFLGIGIMSDAFILAFRLPSFLRKIFAEGALSAAFVPTFSSLMRAQKKHESAQLLTAGLLALNAVLVALTVVVWCWPEYILQALTRGTVDQARLLFAVPLMRVLFPFIFFVANSALFGSVLHATRRFFAVAFGPSLLNVFYLGGLIICMWQELSVYALCSFILLGGAALLLLHVWQYSAQGFALAAPAAATWSQLRTVLKRVPPALLGISSLELNVMIDVFMTAALPAGQVTMVHYGARFMGIPLGVFGVAFSTVLLPHFAQLKDRAPSRFTYYILEATKLVVWLMLPASLALHFFAPAIFTSFLQSKIDVAGVATAANVLSLYGTGLIVFCLHKVVLSLLYAVQGTQTATRGTLLATVSNVVGNSVAVTYYQNVYGVVLSTVFSGVLLLAYLLWGLHTRHNVPFALRRFVRFVPGLLLQVVVAATIYVAAHTLLFNQLLPAVCGSGFFYWLAVAPLSVAMFWLFYRTRKWAGIQLYFLG